MGEVYRARDTRLDRTVAIKILPEALADDPQFRDRFDREARAISQLTHPNVCTLFDVGHEGGTAFLVLEFLEGTTLEYRLKQGALPLEQALTIAIQIAEALSAAHRQGIVHRDLKPGNVMLTKSGAKLLDFGLAKTGVPAAAGSFSMMPTTPPNLTQQGAILGTFQYMAPEQLEGEEADARTDIFAFGAVLYEMIAGRRAFEGKSQASLISAIMTAQPRPLVEQQPLAPPALDYLVATCLKRDPNERWQTAQDLLIQLRWVAQGGSGERAEPAPAPLRRSTLSTALLALAALLVVAMGLPTFRYFRTVPPVLDTIRFEVPTPIMPNAYQVSISPDGHHIAFVALASASGGETAIFVRDVAATTVRQLPGTNRAQQLFWSPDSRSIGFTANGRLRRIEIGGGTPQNICEPGGEGTWNADGVIVFASQNGLFKVAAVGGDATPLTTLDPSRHESAHEWPSFLPDGRHFLYTVWSDQDANRGIFVGSLDSKDRVRVGAAASMAMYAAPGYLFYQRDGTLFAQRFDAGSLQTSGEPIRVAEQVPFNGANGRAAFAVSQNGTLIYRSGSGFAATRQFWWYNKSGKEEGHATEAGPYNTNFDLSLDGKQFAVSKPDLTTGRPDIWIVDSVRDVSTRATVNGGAFAGGFGTDVVLSPDAQQVAYTMNRSGSADIYMRNANGLGDETVLVATPLAEYVEDWSKDGAYLAYGAATTLGGTVQEVRILPLGGERKSFSLVRSEFPVDEPHFSFDTKWVAYESVETGTWQVIVVSFPDGGQKRQISTTGGSQPRWRRDGRELYYLALDGKMMAVDITTSGQKIDSSTPRVLFDSGLTVDPQRDQYAVTPDGQRFLILKAVADAAPTPITVVVNWPSTIAPGSTESR
jgi:Tol biopolymer transport system component